MRKRDFLWLLVFTLLVTLGVWAIFRYVSLPGAFFAAFLPVVLAIACYKTLVEALTWSAQIEITEKATKFTAGYLWSRRSYEYPRRKLPRLECHEEFRRQNGTTYCLRMIPGEGAPCILAKRLDSKQNAVALRDWLMKKMWKA